MSKTIREIMGLDETHGEVGIEIELEACASPMPSFSSNKMWRSEIDDSLRGYSQEYVLKTPIMQDEVKPALNYLKTILDKSKCEPIYSPRAGVHIHVNVQEMTAEQVIRFALVYYCLENVLTKYCGSDREGNHFCLRIRDAEQPLSVIENIFRFKDLYKLNTESIRYATLNFQSLFSYGSLEFRAMSSQPDLSKIEEWVDILLRVKKYALSLENRKDIARSMSFLGPDGFLHSIVGEEHYKNLYYQGCEKEIMDSMRFAQLAIFNKEVV